MLPEEAIKRLKDHFRAHDDGRPTPCLDKAVNTAMVALEKQIPKKPTDTYKRLGLVVEGCCPVCGESVLFGHGCSNNSCRQAIDWTEDNK